MDVWAGVSYGMVIRLGLSASLLAGRTADFSCLGQPTPGTPVHQDPEALKGFQSGGTITFCWSPAIGCEIVQHTKLDLSLALLSPS